MTTHWKKTNEATVFERYRTVLQKDFDMPNGESASYDVISGADTVCLVAITTDDQVLLVEQFRPGTERVHLDLPGGDIDPGEDAATAAKRELEEETGYTGDVVSVHTYPIDAYHTGLRNVFVATNCVPLENQVRHVDVHEYICLNKISLPAFRTHLQTGYITDIAAGYLALDHLNLL